MPSSGWLGSVTEGINRIAADHPPPAGDAGFGRLFALSKKPPCVTHGGFLLGPAPGRPPAVRCGHAWIPACANDSVWCGEGFFVAHEPLCFSMTAYYKIPTPEISRARVAAALSVMAPIQSSTRRYAV